MFAIEVMDTVPRNLDRNRRGNTQSSAPAKHVLEKYFFHVHCDYREYI